MWNKTQNLINQTRIWYRICTKGTQSKKYDMKVGPSTYISTKNVFTLLKPKIDLEHTTRTVYKIECRDCERKYIGNTKYYLHRRIYEHKYSIRINKKMHSICTWFWGHIHEYFILEPTTEVK